MNVFEHRDQGNEHVDRDAIIAAIQDSWSSKTTAVPEEWTPANPARGQCDVSSFVLWEMIGGNLVLARVLVDGVETEHHYWNRVKGEDIDLTRSQFTKGEQIEEIEVVSNDYMDERIPTMRSELKGRVKLLREAVQAKLDRVASQEVESTDGGTSRTGGRGGS